LFFGGFNRWRLPGAAPARERRASCYRFRPARAAGIGRRWAHRGARGGTASLGAGARRRGGRQRDPPAITSAAATF